MNFIKSRLFLLIVFSLVFFQNLEAKDIYAESVEYSAVSEVVSIAKPGDNVYLPSGTAAWGTNQITIPGGIKLIGKGSDKTIIIRSAATNDYLIYFDGTNGLPNELQNIGFEGRFFPGNNVIKGVLFYNGNIDFKVSGCSFTNFRGTALSIGDRNELSARQRGVIYKNRFINNYQKGFNSFGYGIDISGGGVWSSTLALGSKEAVYIEDNYFLGNRHHVASNNGSKYVFRYNTVIHTDVVKNFYMTDAHGLGSAPVGSRSYEIYNNDYSSLSKNASAGPIGIRGGDGVIFNNKVTDVMVSTVTLQLENKSLCSQKSILNGISSLYIWDNEHNDDLYANWELFKNPNVLSLEHGVRNECPASIVKDRNYFLYRKPNYTPYPYPHPSRNLALNKPVDASNYESNGNSIKVVDGDLTRNRGWGHTDKDKSPWWQVDLTDVYQIDGIHIIPFYHGKRYHHYNVQYSLNGKEWITLVTKKDNTIATESGDTYNDFKDVNARFLRVNMLYSSTTYSVSLVEFEVFGKLANGYDMYNNLVKEKVTSSSFHYPANPSERAADNLYEYNSYWSANEKDWWQVDLEENYALNEIVVLNYTDSKRYYKYNIQSSQDGKNWKTIITKNNTDISTRKGNTYYINTSARYLRVNMIENSAKRSVDIIEFRAYGTLANTKSNIKKKDSKPFITANKVRVYPNPVYGTGNLTISLTTNNQETTSLKIVDINGKVVFNQVFPFDQQLITVPVSNLRINKGLYLVTLNNSKWNYTEKIIVQ